MLTHETQMLTHETQMLTGEEEARVRVPYTKLYECCKKRNNRIIEHDPAAC
jgi:hypothetical protein